MSDSKNTSSGGIGICGALFIVFLVLKLAEVGAVAHWSWWRVTSPLWLPFGLVVGVLLATLLLKAAFQILIAPILDWANRRDKLRKF